MNAETAQAAQVPATARRFTVQLSATRRGVRLARLLATEQLRSWELPFEKAAHVVAELAANAVTHGRVPGRDFHLRLTATDDLVRIEVTDTRGDLPIPDAQHPTPETESGRGLLLVEALADRWGVTLDLPPRKTVWAECAMEAP
jgi:anti-sigma regulatory factor (Ser/Thr protein kinase)